MINLSAIHFPSDSLTIGAVRKLHRDKFDGDVNPTFFHELPRSGADRSIGLMLFIERALARIAFDTALGEPLTELLTRDEFVGDLAELYARYGIANGPHHAQQLVRTFEAEATSQARHTFRRHQL
jgi:hypothetical protein